MTSSNDGAPAIGSETVSEEGSTQRTRWVAAGSVLGAVGASSCCILPLVLFSAGVGGAWIGNLTALSPYQPLILGITLAVLGYGFHLVYWKPRRVCADGDTCERPGASRTVRAALWTATALVAAAAAFPFMAPALLGVQ